MSWFRNIQTFSFCEWIIRQPVSSSTYTPSLFSQRSDTIYQLRNNQLIHLPRYKTKITKHYEYQTPTQQQYEYPSTLRPPINILSRIRIPTSTNPSTIQVPTLNNQMKRNETVLSIKLLLRNHSYVLYHKSQLYFAKFFWYLFVHK
jgi:hypothetical protein